MCERWRYFTPKKDPEPWPRLPSNRAYPSLLEAVGRLSTTVASETAPGAGAAEGAAPSRLGVGFEAAEQMHCV